MEQTYNVTTININKIQNKTKIAALKDYLYQSDTDIALLQEVYIRDLYVPGYKAIVNVATENSCGTALLVKEGIDMTDVCLLDSGRGIRCKIINTTFINIYAPSGNNAREERARFFKSDILFLLKDNPGTVLIGGDWNCVLKEKDQRPNFNKSRELEGLVNNMKWKDAWEIKYPTMVRFTYITSRSQSRIDRMYVSSNLENKVTAIEVIPTIFSDHLGVRCSLTLTKQKTYWGRPLWKLNTSLLLEDDLTERLEETWQASLRQRPKYRSTIQWWTAVAKKKLRATLMAYGKERMWWLRSTMEFYYSCLRDLYEQPMTNDIFTQINRTKAKLINLKRSQLEGLKIKSHAQTIVEEENASIYHLIRHEQQRRRNFIEHLRAEDKRLLTNQKDILNEAYRFYNTLYSEKGINDNATREVLLTTGLADTITEEDNRNLQVEITQEEVLDVIKSSPTKKSPGPDGLPVEFYQSYWHLIGPMFTELINEILNGEAVPPDFKQSTTVLIPKGRNTEIKDVTRMRPISLLNSDYKIIARVIKERLIPILGKIIGCHQTCLQGRSIFQTVSEYRDIVSIFSNTTAHGGIAFIDFTKAFDRVNHEYLFKTLTYMGLNDINVKFLTNILKGIKTKVTINGHYTKDIQIASGVPQGSPLSMLLYVVALEPLLRRLDDGLEGITVSGMKKVCNAYADDVGVIIRNYDDITRTTETLRLYSEASGAQINDAKCAFLKLNGLTDVQIGWAKDVKQHTALGLTLHSCPIRTVASNWKKVLDKIRGTLILMNMRTLNIKQKIKLINCAVLSKATYVGQILPLPEEIAKAIMSTVCRYIWQGHIFRVAVGTVTLNSEEGGLGLPDIQKKTTVLFIKRSLQLIEHYPDGITARLFKLFEPKSFLPPVDISTINYKLKHIQHFYLELSYLKYVIHDRNKRNSKYLLNKLRTQEHPNKMELKEPNKNWKNIWKNINNKILTTEIQAAWYRVVNNIVSTNEKLYSIGLSDTSSCQKCYGIDTLDHRFVCQGYRDIWQEIKTQVAFLKRSDGRDINPNVLFFPDEVSFPVQKNNAILWLFGNYVNYIVNEKGNDSILQYREYIREEFYKIYKKKDHTKNFGNMLRIVFQKQGVG